MIKNACQIGIIIITIILVCTTQAFSQNSDTISVQQDRISFKTFFPGIIAVGYGFTALGGGALEKLDDHIATRRNNRRPNFNSQVDDYLRYVPFVALYTLELTGAKGKHNIKDKTSLVLVTAIISLGSTNILKNIIDKERPNGYDFKSFPSGHTAVAFTGAELINQEYGDLSPWYSIAAYSVASATSILRIYSNDHWFSDVVAGAGVGILSTKLAYIVYPHIKRLVIKHEKDLDFTISPSYKNRTLGLSISGKF